MTLIHFVAMIEAVGGFSSETRPGGSSCRKRGSTLAGGAARSIPSLGLTGARLPMGLCQGKGGPLLKSLAANLAPTRPPGAAEQLACLCARVADENKGRDVLVLDMRGLTPIYDYFVIATGASRRQTHTIADEIDDALAKEHETRLGIEGYDAGKWIVLDYGDVLVHVFDPECRNYYELEHLWAMAPRVDWQHSYTG